MLLHSQGYLSIQLKGLKWIEDKQFCWSVRLFVKEHILCHPGSGLLWSKPRAANSVFRRCTQRFSCGQPPHAPVRKIQARMRLFYSLLKVWTPKSRSTPGPKKNGTLNAFQKELKAIDRQGRRGVRGYFKPPVNKRLFSIPGSPLASMWCRRRKGSGKPERERTAWHAHCSI